LHLPRATPERETERAARTMAMEKPSRSGCPCFCTTCAYVSALALYALIAGYSGHYLKRHGMYDCVPSIQKLSVAAILAVALEIVTALGLFASVSAPG
jgi:hypothetical protein